MACRTSLLATGHRSPAGVVTVTAASAVPAFSTEVCQRRSSGISRAVSHGKALRDSACTNANRRSSSKPWRVRGREAHASPRMDLTGYLATVRMTPTLCILPPCKRLAVLYARDVKGAGTRAHWCSEQRFSSTADPFIGSRLGGQVTLSSLVAFKETGHAWLARVH